jgi:hypothetical protein
MVDGTKFDYDEQFVAVSTDLGRVVEELKSARNSLNETYRLLGIRRMAKRMEGVDTREIDEKINVVLQAIRECGAKIDATQTAHLSHLLACQVGYTDR